MTRKANVGVQLRAGAKRLSLSCRSGSHMTQHDALDILKTGSNVYLTGTAGSGKTYLLQHYLQYLKIQGIKVAITASTGVAATQLSGMTIQAWSGLGVKSRITDGDIADLLKRKYLHKRFEGTQVLIIDEISMLSSVTLEALDKVCQAFKDSSLPFGGMQVVLCGDFFQLPPVDNYNNEHFVYKSSVWQELDLKVCYLTTPYRQNDERFVRLLSEIRDNNITKGTWETLKERFLNPILPGMTPTRLFTHNSQADLVNKEELSKLKGEDHLFEMQMEGNDILGEVIKKSSLIPERLILRERALVMFIKNSFDEGYVNGTMGRVISFSPDGYPIIQKFTGEEIKVKPALWTIDEGEGEKARVTQLPLRLAWAITIHKSQGMSLDAAEIDLGKSFVSGMGYVALSRVRTLEGLRLRSINPTALKVNEDVIEFDRELQLESERTALELRDHSWQQIYKSELRV